MKQILCCPRKPKEPGKKPWGCIAQAWIVAEVQRCWAMTEAIAPTSGRE